MQGSGLAVALVIGVAVLAANLPFINERAFGLLPWPGGQVLKPGWARLIELVVLYGVVGAIARLVEGRLGSVKPQDWEFFAVTACLFVVAAYPGFVWRYLRRGHPRPDLP